ncbi:MAG TPA: FG-GAP-like repeat-containing protein [Micromonosporaceae bacterium]
MSVGLRTAVVATVVAVASYGIVGTTGQAAAAAPTDSKVKLAIWNTYDLAVDDVHQRVFVAGAEGLQVLDYDGQTVKTIEGRFVHLTLPADSSQVYAVRQLVDTRITVVDTATLDSRDVDLGAGVCPYSAALTGGKLWFSYATCFTSQTALGSYDPATGEVRTGLLSTPRWAYAMRADPNRPDRLAFLGGFEGHLAVYDVSVDPPVLVVDRAPSQPANCVDGVVAAGGDRLVTACARTPGHEVYRTADLTSEPALDTSGQGVALDLTPDQRYVAAGVFGSGSGDVLHIEIFDIENGTPGSFVRGYEFPYGLAQRGLAFGGKSRLFAIEAAPDAKYLHILHDPLNHPTPVAVSVPAAVDYLGTIRGTGWLGYPPGEVTTATLTRINRAGSQQLGSVQVAPDGRFSFTDPLVGTTGPTTYVVGHPGDETHPPAKGQASTIIRPLEYDVNADGHADTVVGAPGEDEFAGMFHLLYGSANGPKAVGSLAIHQDTPGVPGAKEFGDGFGQVNASGDFNGDGYADLAVSAPHENFGAGAVWVFQGSALGLRTDSVRVLDFGDTVRPHSDPSPDFGFSLAAGDFNGDGRDDLVVGGAPWYGPGYVSVFHGTGTGAFSYLGEYTQGTPGVPGSNRDGDAFGYSLVAGDVNGDRRDDLAVGAPGDSEDRGWATGSVTLFYAGSEGLTGTGAQRWTKDSTGVPGGPGSFNESRDDSSDGFGSRLGLADFNGDAKADLAVGAPGSPVYVDGVRKRDAGTVTMLYSDGHRIGTAGAIQVTQQTTGMPGTAGQEDWFGATLASGDSTGDGRAELAVYSPGDTYVTVIPGGLTYGGARAWTQNSAGIPGTTEPGDYWGRYLRFVDVKGIGQDSLVVGASDENGERGAVTVIPSTTTGLTGVGAQWFSQDTTGVPGTAEPYDYFGTF